MLFTTESSYYNKYMTNEKCLILVFINKTATYLEMKNVQKYLHLLHY